MTARPFAIVCVQGCCPGCRDCYGMSIGCHQTPCRCALPCTCRWADEAADPHWRGGCQRHDSTDDTRRYEVQMVDYDDSDEYLAKPCETCGAPGACGYDPEGRALIHVTDEPDNEER